MLGMALAMASTALAQTAGNSCDAGDLSGPDDDGDNLICSGGVFVKVSASGSGVSDRISSTNDAAMVRAFAGGTVSFTTGGVAGTSYLDATGRWIGPGISLTTAHGISSTNGYFSGNVGIGTSTPETMLQVVSPFYSP